MKGLLKFLFGGWAGELFVARRRVTVTCPHCKETFSNPEGQFFALFSNMERAKAYSELPVLAVLHDAPEIAPTVYGRDPPEEA